MTAISTSIAISNHFLSFVIAEAIVVILYNLKRTGMFSTSTASNSTQYQQRRPYMSVIGSAIPLVMVLLVVMSTVVVPSSMVVEALSAVSPPKNNVIAITHAAGRMGKVLALQLREDAALRYQSRRVVDSNDDGEDEDEDDMESYLPKIRAIVRSEKEAYSVRCDLGGMKMVSGSIAQPIALDWLECIIIDTVALDASERPAKLRDAFEGCRAAILCDASHNELVWNEDLTSDSSTDYTNTGYSIVVPASENKDHSRRLLEEIDATSHSSTLEHVVLRSTMGLAVARASEAQRLYMDQNPVLPMEVEIDWEALARAMGGEAALAGPREAEKAFRNLAETCSINSLSESCNISRRHTILRLGALTDDAGMVPLVFGSNDSILIKTTDDCTKNYRPPILSRADAARVSTVLVRSEYDEFDTNNNPNNEGGNLVTIDCAWHPKYGRDSVGREETVSHAVRQDLKQAIVEAIPAGVHPAGMLQ